MVARSLFPRWLSPGAWRSGMVGLLTTVSSRAGSSVRRAPLRQGRVVHQDHPPRARVLLTKVYAELRPGRYLVVNSQLSVNHNPVLAAVISERQHVIKYGLR